MARVLQLWYFKEGNRAHEKQSAALIEALAAQIDCQIHPVETQRYKFGLRLDEALLELPKPDVLVGAGHGTHWPMIRTKLSLGGHVVVIMKPSLPLSWFDSAIIPRHDSPKIRPSTFVSQGMLNPGFDSQADKAQGVILLGGTNKYFAWPEADILTRINAITAAAPDCHWQISNSRRTPAEFNHKALERDNVSWVDWQSEGPQWLPQQLSRAGRIWVSCDSMSMIYEALNSRAEVGVIRLPALKADNKMALEVGRLIEQKQVISSEEEVDSQARREPLNEHLRAAKWLLKKI